MKRRLACSDLHGSGKLWDKIKEFLRPGDILFMLGDAGDRGPDSWRVLKESILHPQIYYILGNHDVMFLDYLKHNSEFDMVWFRNGGDRTWSKAKNDPNLEIVANKLEERPYHKIYINDSGLKIYLNHSGRVSEDPDDELWDRRHYFFDNIPEEYDIIVHGHTPIDSMIEDFSYRKITDFKWDYGHVCYYHGNTKINIDCGARWEGFTVLLDLDTFEEHVIGEVKEGVVW